MLRTPEAAIGVVNFARPTAIFSYRKTGGNYNAKKEKYPRRSGHGQYPAATGREVGGAYHRRRKSRNGQACPPQYLRGHAGGRPKGNDVAAARDRQGNVSDAEQDHRQGLKPLTVSAYDTAIRTHILPAIGAVQLQAVKGIQIQKLYNDMQSAGKSPKTVKNVSALLHKSFSVAVKQGYLAANPCDAAETPKVTRPEIHPLTDREIPLFLSAIDAHPYRNAYALCLFAGLREGECLGLSWDGVDFERKRLTIRQQLQKSKTQSSTYTVVSSTKSGKVRVIEPPAIAFVYLRAERVRQAENRLLAGRMWSNPDDLVFTNELGGNLIIETFRRNFKRLAAGIGRPDLRPHDLRHTCATVAIASGGKMKKSA